MSKQIIHPNASDLLTGLGIQEKVLQYDRQNMLGSGTFAAVFSGTLDGQPVAVKQILLYNLNKNFKTRGPGSCHENNGSPESSETAGR
jgi:hypothetical protein